MDVVQEVIRVSKCISGVILEIKPGLIDSEAVEECSESWTSLIYLDTTPVAKVIMKVKSAQGLEQIDNHNRHLITETFYYRQLS